MVDDGSTDATAEVAARFGATVVAAPPLPDGWLGKPWACDVGAGAAAGDHLLFLDADTWLAPDALARLSWRPWPGRAAVGAAAPPHRARRTSRLSAFPNLVSMMGSGAFVAVAAPAPAGRVRARACSRRGPTTSGPAGTRPCGPRWSRTSHLARAYRAAGLPVAVPSGGDDRRLPHVPRWRSASSSRAGRRTWRPAPRVPHRSPRRRGRLVGGRAAAPSRRPASWPASAASPAPAAFAGAHRGRRLGRRGRSRCTGSLRPDRAVPGVDGGGLRACPLAGLRRRVRRCPLVRTVLRRPVDLARPTQSTAGVRMSRAGRPPARTRRRSSSTSWPGRRCTPARATRCTGSRMPRLGDAWLYRRRRFEGGAASTGGCSACRAGRTGSPKPARCSPAASASDRCRPTSSAASSASSSRPGGPSSATGWPPRPARCSCCGTRGRPRSCWWSTGWRPTCRASRSSATTGCGPSGCSLDGLPGRAPPGAVRAARRAAEPGTSGQQHPVGLAAGHVVDPVRVTDPLEVPAGRGAAGEAAVDADVVDDHVARRRRR